MTDLFNLKGRNALVVGGTSGIGRVLALGLAQAGANTAATGRRGAEVAKVTKEIEEYGVESFALACDATDPHSLQTMKAGIEQHFQGLDILVYAAGMTIKKPTAEITLEDWQKVQDVNLNGALLTCQAFYPLLKESKHARVITITSLTSTTAFHQVAAYAASKSALLSLTKSLACEWAGDGIKVNAITPGVFVTDLNREILNGTPRGAELLMRTPMKRFGEIEELVGAALFLASDAASFITGITIPADGGFLASGVNQ